MKLELVYGGCRLAERGRSSFGMLPGSFVQVVAGTFVPLFRIDQGPGHAQSLAGKMILYGDDLNWQEYPEF